MEKILSICIASYNKSVTTYRLVESLLSNPNHAFEVVVVDNASTDDTFDRLQTINDSRLRVIRNDENIGGARNFLASVFEGKGIFCLYTNDRDIIYPDKLDSFISYLKNNTEIGGGHCVRYKIPGIETNSIEHKGIDALLTINFRGEHPTGFFFRRALLDAIPQDTLKDYGLIEPYLSFPWEGFLLEIICKGFIVVEYNNEIWQSTGDTTHSKYKSGYYTDEDEERWFFPKNRLRLTISETNETLRIAKENGLELNIDERYALYAHLLAPQYTFAVHRYKVIYETPSLAFHYRVPNRKVSRKETNNCKQEMIQGYLCFIRQIEGSYNEKESLIIDAMKSIDKRHKVTLRLFLGKIKKKIIESKKNK